MNSRLEPGLPPRADASAAVADAFARRLARGDVDRRPVAIVVAHPDDETFGLGSRLSRLPHSTLAHVTDGAPRDLVDARREGFDSASAYAEARRHELDAALEALGSAAQRLALDLPDQESIDHLPWLVRALLPSLADVDVVVTHPYEHGHPDHDVASLAVHAGCALLEREHGAAPAIVEFASYHLDGSRLAFGEFFPAPRHPEHVARHDDADRARKARALRCFRTQHAIFGSMVAPDERFRAAPRYDFAQPAPPGAAWYDRLGWRITSAEWRRRAVRGLAELGLDPAPWR